MTQISNPGFSPEEIKRLKELCATEQRTFILIEDEDLPVSNDREMVHIQFVGHFEQKEVVYDAILCTLQLHYSSLLYEAAEREAIQHFPLYVPIENRDETYQANDSLDEEVEMMVLEIIEEMEENDEIKVSEYVEVDKDFDFGIGLEAALYVPALTDEVIEQFIHDFNADAIQLDTSLYSFKSEEE
ncbi:hypothetical protein EWU23_02060 [Cytophagaceae bacterium 50C-KIRBA]|uniref:DUF4194 domain-containing protein n=1 Tax=Aquirufa beregesia TaxID=2516556 RepID=A0ABX0EV00_9BACT|nr:hypothetical protein [Aquirufa beregesia]NGZ43252.1 hypothetical protein [Aquirufa beregesia]